MTLISSVATPKALSLITLTVQNCLLAILMRMASDEGKYLRTVAVMMDELLKLVVCIGILFVFYVRARKEGNSYQPINESNEINIADRGFILGWFAFVESEVFGSISGFMTMCIPAICYAIQKNLLFVSIRYLNPAVFQILFQGKILTTAFFSWWILKKEFSKRQKLSMLVLFIGCGLVQLSTLDQSSSSKHDASGSGVVGGLLAILLACLTSGFSAVYLERAIKGAATNGAAEKPHTIWVRNIQLSTFGFIASTIGAIIEDKAKVDRGGVLQGFSVTVWSTVCMSSFGGLLVALVMKYADNILKTFATSVAIILTSIISAMFFELEISISFVIGAGLTLYAVHMYSYKPGEIAPVETTKAEEMEEFGAKATSH